MKKFFKRTCAVMLCVVLICTCFAGCSSSDGEKYTDETVIIGYVPDSSPFISVNKNGDVTGFEVDLWKKIFDDVKGDMKKYVFEDITKLDDFKDDPYSYELESDGGFYDSSDKEYSAALLFGAISKNHGTFNEDYSFTEPIITDRVITVTAKGSSIKSYGDLTGKTVAVAGDTAEESFKSQTAIYSSCKVTETESLDDALALIDSGKADAVVTNELSFNPNKKASSYTVLDGELDTIEYVIACAKYSDWYNSINEAIRELKSKDYGDGDEFTPLVEKYFGYNASQFDYKAEGDEA